MTTAAEILATLREIRGAMTPDELADWLFAYGFMVEELDIVSAGAVTLRAIARELERLATPALPTREYPSLAAWERIARRGGRVPRELTTAAMYESAARDSDAEARHWLARLHEPGAAACMRSATRAADDAMRRAASLLAEAERQREQEVRHAA